MPSGHPSRACSANCHPFLRAVSLKMPCRYASTRHRGSERAQRGPILACKRKRDCTQPETSARLVLLPVMVICCVCFMNGSFQRGSLHDIATATESHI